MADPAPVRFEKVTFAWEEGAPPVFRDLDLELPRGVVSLVGQNGTGKSTLLMLAAGSVLPGEGRVLIHGVDTRDLRDEETRHRQVSIIYQNMEFETEDPIGVVLRYVHGKGTLAGRNPELVAELEHVFELDTLLGRKLQQLSKGELQRAILAFSLLYGSPIVIMDEPVFALERHQRVRAMEYLTAYAARSGISIYYSAHELELSERYSDYILLFPKAGPPVLGTTAQVFVRERIEEAFQVPMTMLKTRERLYRALLIERAERERTGPP